MKNMLIIVGLSVLPLIFVVEFLKYPKLKPKLYPWALLASGVLFVGLTYWLEGLDLATMIVFISFVILIVLLGMTFCKFCTSCGYCFYPNSSKSFFMKYCPKCKAKLENCFKKRNKVSVGN